MLANQQYNTLAPSTPEPRPAPPESTGRIIHPMLRLAFIFLGTAAIGMLIFATGLGHLGMCADEGGAMAALLILTGLPLGTLLLAIVGALAAWRRWKYRPRLEGV